MESELKQKEALEHHRLEKIKQVQVLREKKTLEKQVTQYIVSDNVYI